MFKKLKQKLMNKLKQYARKLLYFEIMMLQNDIIHLRGELERLGKTFFYPTVVISEDYDNMSNNIVLHATFDIPYDLVKINCAVKHEVDPYFYEKRDEGFLNFTEGRLIEELFSYIQNNTTIKHKKGSRYET